MQALVVEFRIHPEHIGAFAQAMVANARASLADEPGCHQFDVCRSGSEPGLFFLYELYTDAAAIQAHLASAHFRHFNELTRPWVADKQVRTLQRVEPR